jgi:hypothetical protein
MLRYIQGIKELSLMFERNEKERVELFGFCDSDWAGSMDDMKINVSTHLFLGQVYFYGHQRNKMSDTFINES